MAGALPRLGRTEGAGWRENTGRDLSTNHVAAFLQPTNQSQAWETGLHGRRGTCYSPQGGGRQTCWLLITQLAWKALFHYNNDVINYLNSKATKQLRHIFDPQRVSSKIAF